MAMLTASRRLSTGSVLSDSLRYSSSWRFFSTSFREERDTFGPILVPEDNLLILQQASPKSKNLDRVIKSSLRALSVEAGRSDGSRFSVLKRWKKKRSPGTRSEARRRQKAIFTDKSEILGLFLKQLIKQTYTLVVSLPLLLAGPLCPLLLFDCCYLLVYCCSSSSRGFAIFYAQAGIEFVSRSISV
ncbi:hypothetical protein HAX54_001757 [Datura stramonium]|uniref:Uncharacterized protein n=1 Tax=Datura stramonium TaxID=4076 RepID=A0ABS8RSU6_DATST|nr:hypothetical protein [Datura stramonium]